MHFVLWYIRFFLTVFNHVFHISVLGLEGLGLDSDSLDIKDLNQLEAIINGNFDGNFDFQLWVQHTSCTFYYKLCKFMDI